VKRRFFTWNQAAGLGTVTTVIWRLSATLEQKLNIGLEDRLPMYRNPIHKTEITARCVCALAENYENMVKALTM